MSKGSCLRSAIWSLAVVWSTARIAPRPKKAAAAAGGSEPKQKRVEPGQLPCDAPVAKGPVRFPESLLVGDTDGAPMMWSGYVNVTDRDYLFYILAEAEAGAPDDAPVVVWSNGGPGCSSMEGATTEHGPFLLYGVKEEGRQFSGRLSRNPFAWNRDAHVLYVDQPRYVGFSCGSGDFVSSSEDAGKDLVAFLRGWRLLYPQHAKRDLIFAAESYGGHYVPAWASAVFDFNAAQPREAFQLRGLAIGNGIVDDFTQADSLREFAKLQGLLPKNRSMMDDWDVRDLIAAHLGYEPNYYDFRLTEQTCCGCSSYNYKPWTDWLLREDVLQALNVCGNAGTKAFGFCAAGCIDLPDFDVGTKFDFMAALSRALQKGVQVTMYYGMQDTACNYVGGYKVAKSFTWPGAAAFAESPLEDLVISGVRAGKIQSGGGLTWMQVEGAGHMVPVNNPLAAFYAIGTLIHGGAEGTGASSLRGSAMLHFETHHVAGRLQGVPSGSRYSGHKEQMNGLKELLMAFGCGSLSMVILVVARAWLAPLIPVASLSCDCWSHLLGSQSTTYSRACTTEADDGGATAAAPSPPHRSRGATRRPEGAQLLDEARAASPPSEPREGSAYR